MSECCVCLSLLEVQLRPKHRAYLEEEHHAHQSWEMLTWCPADTMARGGTSSRPMAFSAPPPTPYPQPGSQALTLPAGAHLDLRVYSMWELAGPAHCWQVA